MDAWSPEVAARWIAEAVESGNPLATLPSDLAPRDVTEASAVAVAVLDSLGIVPCGVRLLLRPGLPALVGPMIEGRLLPGSATVACRSLRHPMLSAGVVGVLSAPLEAEDNAPPRFATLHPAIDVAATRYTETPDDAVALTADLARLGLVIAGKGKPLAPGVVRVAMGPAASRSRGAETDLAAVFGQAAKSARNWGGLPAGALLVVAGLTSPLSPVEGVLRASLGALGGVAATFS